MAEQLIENEKYQIAIRIFETKLLPPHSRTLNYSIVKSILETVALFNNRSIDEYYGVFKNRDRTTTELTTVANAELRRLKADVQEYADRLLHPNAFFEEEVAGSNFTAAFRSSLHDVQAKAPRDPNVLLMTERRDPLFFWDSQEIKKCLNEYAYETAGDVMKDRGCSSKETTPKPKPGGPVFNINPVFNNNNGGAPPPPAPPPVPSSQNGGGGALSPADAESSVDNGAHFVGALIGNFGTDQPFHFGAVGEAGEEEAMGDTAPVADGGEEPLSGAAAARSGGAAHPSHAFPVSLLDIAVLGGLTRRDSDQYIEASKYYILSRNNKTKPDAAGVQDVGSILFSLPIPMVVAAKAEAVPPRDDPRDGFGQMPAISAAGEGIQRETIQCRTSTFVQHLQRGAELYIRLVHCMIKPHLDLLRHPRCNIDPTFARLFASLVGLTMQRAELQNPRLTMNVSAMRKRTRDVNYATTETRVLLARHCGYADNLVQYI